MKKYSQTDEGKELTSLMHDRFCEKADYGCPCSDLIDYLHMHCGKKGMNEYKKILLEKEKR